MNRSNPEFLAGCLSFGTICYRSVPIGSHRNISECVPSISYFSLWLLPIQLVYNCHACKPLTSSSSIIQIPDMTYKSLNPSQVDPSFVLFPHLFAATKAHALPGIPAMAVPAMLGRLEAWDAVWFELWDGQPHFCGDINQISVCYTLYI